MTDSPDTAWVARRGAGGVWQRGTIRSIDGGAGGHYVSFGDAPEIHWANRLLPGTATRVAPGQLLWDVIDGTVPHNVLSTPEGAGVVARTVKEAGTELALADLERKLRDLGLVGDGDDWKAIWKSLQPHVRDHPHVLVAGAKYAWSDVALEKTAKATSVTRTREPSAGSASKALSTLADELVKANVRADSVERVRSHLRAYEYAQPHQFVAQALTGDLPELPEPSPDWTALPSSLARAVVRQARVQRRADVALSLALGGPDPDARESATDALKAVAPQDFGDALIAALRAPAAGVDIPTLVDRWCDAASAIDATSVLRLGLQVVDAAPGGSLESALISRLQEAEPSSDDIAETILMTPELAGAAATAFGTLPWSEPLRSSWVEALAACERRDDLTDPQTWQGLQLTGLDDLTPAVRDLLADEGVRKVAIDSAVQQRLAQGTAADLSVVLGLPVAILDAVDPQAVAAAIRGAAGRDDFLGRLEGTLRSN